MDKNKRTDQLAESRIRYQHLNSEFDRKFIYQLGTGRGYCAEMIHLLKVIQMCLHRNLQLRLGAVSNPSGFIVCKGWEDYFLPVFPVHEGPLLEYLNRSYFPFGRVPLLQGISRKLLNLTNGANYYMFDDLEFSFSNELFDIKLGLRGNYWNSISGLIRAIYQYREDVSNKIAHYNNRLEIGDSIDYFGIHVRRGDKISESPYTPLESYARVITERNTRGMPIYLATDDFSIVAQLGEVLGNNYDILSQAPACAKGYEQNHFNRQTTNDRWEATVFFLSELEMLINATIFIGASPSNVFYWTRYNRANQNMIDVTKS